MTEVTVLRLEWRVRVCEGVRVHVSLLTNDMFLGFVFIRQIPTRKCTYPGEQWEITGFQGVLCVERAEERFFISFIRQMRSERRQEQVLLH